MRHFLLLLMLFPVFTAYSQYQSPYLKEENVKREIPLPKYYISAGSGIQYKYGLLGLGLGYRVTETTILELNTGIGAYGTKVGISGIFNSIGKNAWCPYLGFSKTSGVNELNTEFEVVYNGLTSKVNTSVYLDPVNTLNAGIQKQFVTKRGNRFTIDLGYAISLNKQVYGFNDKTILVGNQLVPADEVKFSNNQKSAIQILGPSGITIGVSYNYGF